MKQNTNHISGILHPQKGAPSYDLRRYFPSNKMACVVEQYWMVNWEFLNEASHEQTNLPDFNFHIVLTYQLASQGVYPTCMLIGPSSKTYQYAMYGHGKIIGVKLSLGALHNVLPSNLKTYVDKKFVLSDVININTTELCKRISCCSSDCEVVAVLESLLTPFVSPVSAQLALVQELVNTIQHDSALTTVEQLCVMGNVSARTLQRYFEKYIGVHPKWVIRKYRLHQAVAMLESHNPDKPIASTISDIVAWLGYTDQSHLIRDFKSFLGYSPSKY